MKKGDKMKQEILIFSLSLILISCIKKSQNSESKDIFYSGPTNCNLLGKAAVMALEPQIVGGTPATDSSIITGSNTVAIILNDASDSSKRIICSGTIVQSNLILTAGHCFDDVDLNSTSPGIVVFADSFSSYNASQATKISCWQRPRDYIPCNVKDTYKCILNDIAWIKIPGSIKNGYSTVNILKNPQTISSTETKWMAGFGDLNDSGLNYAAKNVVESTTSASNPDMTPEGAVQAFNTLTFSNAFESFLTVIGPDAGKGTCEGDSGGPVYVLRNGNYVLAAITQGSNSLLSPHPITTFPPYQFDTNKYATCNDGYGVYTTIGNYIDWIQSSSGIHLSTY